MCIKMFVLNVFFHDSEQIISQETSFATRQKATYSYLLRLLYERQKPHIATVCNFSTRDKSHMFLMLELLHKMRR